MFLPCFLLSTVSRVTTTYILPIGWVEAGTIGMNDDMYDEAIDKMYGLFNSTTESEVWFLLWNSVMAAHQVWIHLTSFMFWLIVVCIGMKLVQKVIDQAISIVNVVYFEPIAELMNSMDHLINQIVPSRFKPYLFLSNL